MGEGQGNLRVKGRSEGVKVAFPLALLVLGCVPRPYSDFQRAIDGASEADLRALDASGREGGLLLIALLATDLAWSLQERRDDRDPLLVVESVGNWRSGCVPGFERFYENYKPPREIHVILSNPLAVVWAMERDKERRNAKDGK